MILTDGLRFTNCNVFKPGDLNFARVHEQASSIVEKIENATDIFVAEDNGPYDSDSRDGFVEVRGLRTDSGLYTGRLNAQGEIRYQRRQGLGDSAPELGASAVTVRGLKQYQAIALLDEQHEITFACEEPSADGGIRTEEGSLGLNYLLLWDEMTAAAETYRPGSWS